MHGVHMQTHLATALTEIIERSFDGNRTEFSKKCGVVYTTIHRICAGDVAPTLDKLNDICQVLNLSDRKQLLLAAARDRIPAQYQAEIFGPEERATNMIRAKLAPDLSAVIRYLEDNAMSDPLTADYLRRIGKWVGITGEQTPSINYITALKEEKKSKVAAPVKKYITQNDKSSLSDSPDDE